jgi:release factor glutamine methyltransferase
MPDTVVSAPGGVCTVRGLRAELAAYLHGHGVAAAAAESRDILAAVLDVPRFWPSMHADDAVAPEAVRQARLAAGRRAAGAPFAYASGRASFRHLTLEVDERVLIPRQETEQLVELALATCGPAASGIAIDIGTGSGAIALALATEGRFDRVIATDISADALVVARRNAQRLHGALRAPVEFRLGADLSPVRDLRGSARVLVASPPYIAFDEARDLPSSVRDWEPGIALFAGRGGMAAIAELVRGGASVLAPGGVIVLEVDLRRAALAAELLAAHGAYRAVGVRLDLTGRERFVVARRED